MTTVNWADLAANASDGPIVLPDGEYDARVVASTHKQTQTGKDMFNVTFEVVNGPSAGSKVYNNLVVSPESPNALGYFFRDMATLGVDSAFFATNPGHQAIADRILGTVVTLRLGHKEYQGVTRNEVKGMKPYAGAPIGTPQAPAPSAAPVPQAPVPQAPVSAGVQAGASSPAVPF